MNGVAKQFWSEVLDIRAPVDDGRGRKTARRSRKSQKRTLSSQTRRTSRPAA